MYIKMPFFAYISDLVSKLQKQLITAKKSLEDEDHHYSDFPSSDEAPPKFDLSSDSEDHRSTPTDTEDSGVASTSHSTCPPKSSPAESPSQGFKVATPANRLRTKSKLSKHTPKVKRKSLSSPKALRHNLSDSSAQSCSPVKSKIVDTTTPFITHRTEPNRTQNRKVCAKDKASHTLSAAEISSILPCGDDVDDMPNMSPMLSSTRQSFLQISKSHSTPTTDSNSRPKAADSSGLRQLLSKPLASMTKTSTPIVAASHASNQPKGRVTSTVVTCPQKSKQSNTIHTAIPPALSRPIIVQIPPGINPFSLPQGVNIQSLGPNILVPIPSTNIMSSSITGTTMCLPATSSVPATHTVTSVTASTPSHASASTVSTVSSSATTGKFYTSVNHDSPRVIVDIAFSQMWYFGHKTFPFINVGIGYVLHEYRFKISLKKLWLTVIIPLLI